MSQPRPADAVRDALRGRGPHRGVVDRVPSAPRRFYARSLGHGVWAVVTLRLSEGRVGGLGPLRGAERLNNSTGQSWCH